jgi:hypothetical protein
MDKQIVADANIFQEGDANHLRNAAERDTRHVAGKHLLDQNGYG